MFGQTVHTWAVSIPLAALFLFSSLLLQKRIIGINRSLHPPLKHLQLSPLLRGFALVCPPLGLFVKLFGDLLLLKPMLIGLQVLKSQALRVSTTTIRQPHTSVWVLKRASPCQCQFEIQEANQNASGQIPLSRSPCLVENQLGAVLLDPQVVIRLTLVAACVSQRLSRWTTTQNCSIGPPLDHEDLAGLGMPVESFSCPCVALHPSSIKPRTDRSQLPPLSIRNDVRPGFTSGAWWQMRMNIACTRATSHFCLSCLCNMRFPSSTFHTCYIASL